MTRMVPAVEGKPAYRLKTPLEIFQTEWKLTDCERDNLSNYALRHWNISELLEYTQFADDGIHLTVRLWNVVYSATLKVRPNTNSMLNYLLSRDHGWRDPVNDKQPMFWLSFRSGVVDGQEFAYVIVQEDTGNGKMRVVR